MAKIQFQKVSTSTHPKPLDKSRELDEIEIEAEDKAEKLPKGKFARIPPIPGTLGFMFRNIPGGNAAIIRYMEVYTSKSSKHRSGSRKNLVDFIILWKSFDEFSQRRVDIFDWFCKKAGIDPARIWGAICEGMFDVNEADIAVELVSAKSELISNVRKFGRNERNFRDRELLAKATKLTEEKGIEVDARTINNVTNNNLQLQTSGFNAAIRANENLIRDEKVIEISSKEVKELTEGNKDYIDTEFFQTKKEIDHVST